MACSRGAVADNIRPVLIGHLQPTAIMPVRFNSVFWIGPVGADQITLDLGGPEVPGEVTLSWSQFQESFASWTSVTR